MTTVAINQQTTNPMELNERVTAIQLAQAADELSALATEYTSAGAISFPGTALLKTGTAGAMTLAQPVAGPLPTGQDGQRLRITALDAHAYIVTAAANGIAPSHDTLTAAGGVGDSVTLVAFGGLWYIEISTTGTPAWAATEV